MIVAVHATWEPDWLGAPDCQWLFPDAVFSGEVHPGSFRCPYYFQITPRGSFVEPDQLPYTYNFAA